MRKGADIIGKTLDQIDFRKRFDVAVLGLKRGETHQPGPLSEMVVNANDVLVLLGDNEEVLQKPEVKAVFKDVEKLDEALEKEYLTGSNFNLILQTKLILLFWTTILFCKIILSHLLGAGSLLTLWI